MEIPIMYAAVFIYGNNSHQQNVEKALLGNRCFWSPSNLLGQEIDLIVYKC